MYCTLLRLGLSDSPGKHHPARGLDSLQWRLSNLNAIDVRRRHLHTQEQFEPNEFIETIKRERVTHVKMVPSQIVP